ncbi:hypothetical protein BV898_09737 [Hypsibius exemplaris]|uniref:Cadherin domain-containing protein n=1 Tax=Hypsibius exemplaris TaxID=2072580 RepID=A0A1W0WLL1_HYPEX|nr:hypothetical protein BV898_09737 [Hypsibius exemplaris]
MKLICCSTLAEIQPFYHRLIKRQTFPITATSQLPVFSQTAYTLYSQCQSGSQAGTVTATNLNGGTTTYSIDPGTGSPYNVQINPTTGQVTIINTPQGGFMFSVKATNNFGSTAVPVTVFCNGYSSCGSTYPYSTGIQQTYPYYNTGTSYCNNVGIYPYTSGSTYPYNTGSIYPYNTGSIYPYNTGSTYPYNTGSTYPYNTGSAYPYNTGSVYPYTSNTGIYGSTGLTQASAFTQSTYQFTQSGCSNYIGSVTATGNSVYSIGTGSNNFTIDAGGAIRAAVGLTPGTYQLTVLSTGISGTQSTAQVSVTIVCTTTGSGTSFG